VKGKAAKGTGKSRFRKKPRTKEISPEVGKKKRIYSLGGGLQGKSKGGNLLGRKNTEPPARKIRGRRSVDVKIENGKVNCAVGGKNLKPPRGKG